MKNDAKKIVNYIRAGFSCFWIATPEPHRVEVTIGEMIKNHQLKSGETMKVKTWRCTDVEQTSPPKPIGPEKILSRVDEGEDDTIFFLHNFHWALEKSKYLIQMIQNSFNLWASNGKAIVVISPTTAIPLELQKYFTLLEMNLPDEEELETAMNVAIQNAPEDKKPKKKEEIKRLISSGKGLTMNEFANVCSLSLIENGSLLPKTISDYKAQIFSKSGFLTVIPPKRTFDHIVGYEPLKEDIRSTINDPRSKGSLLIGHPGTGKTTLLYGIAGEYPEKIVLMVVIGKLFSKYHGETDANVDYVISLLKALAGNVVVIIDEFEKQFSGVGGSGDTDSGVTIRANSRWLDFFQDRPEGIQVYGTANATKGIPPEYLRAGRWDTAPYFVGLPNTKTKKEILKHYLAINKIKTPTQKKMPKMERYTGADVEALVHNASMRKIPLLDAQRLIRPQAITHKEKFDELESWAEGNCIMAEDAITRGNGRKLDI